MQVYQEGSSILYGDNVFKFRSCHGEGQKSIELPTKHLHLLKHIKLSVISSLPDNGQEQWVAGILENFRDERMDMESFEMTWYGWKRLHLRAQGLVCQVLRSLRPKRLFAIKINGEARMEKEMAQVLIQNLHAQRVEIQRPMKEVTGEELTDEEE